MNSEHECFLYHLDWSFIGFEKKHVKVYILLFYSKNIQVWNNKKQTLFVNI